MVNQGDQLHKTAGGGGHQPDTWCSTASQIAQAGGRLRQAVRSHVRAVATAHCCARQHPSSRLVNTASGMRCRCCTTRGRGRCMRAPRMRCSARPRRSACPAASFRRSSSPTRFPCRWTSSSPASPCCPWPTCWARCEYEYKASCFCYSFCLGLWLVGDVRLCQGMSQHWAAVRGPVVHPVLMTCWAGRRASFVPGPR